MTLVDFTTATATEPGSRPSSRAASLDMSDTTRKGPHCSSTCAITLSIMTSVTMPTNLLRAERPTDDGSAMAPDGCSLANCARTRPSITLRLLASVVAGRLPLSTSRRTVSSLTPRNAAASLIRICGIVECYRSHLRRSVHESLRACQRFRRVPLRPSGARLNQRKGSAHPSPLVEPYARRRRAYAPKPR